MTDKDFKEQNNYREVECCGNCEHFNFTALTFGECCIIDEVKGLEESCDKWEHE